MKYRQVFRLQFTYVSLFFKASFYYLFILQQIHVTMYIKCMFFTLLGILYFWNIKQEVSM